MKKSFLDDFGECTSCVSVSYVSNPFMGQFRQPYVCWLMFAGLNDHFEEADELF